MNTPLTLHAALLGCQPFASDRALRAIFADSRLALWQADLPEADTVSGRVDSTLAYLKNKQAGRRNGTTWLLEVLAERLDPEDALHPQLLALAADLARAADPFRDSPYKGLHYFDEKDAHLFFGRQQLAKELLTHLEQYPFLAVVGASGSGKSSLVRAGVLPAVRRAHFGPRDIHVITPTSDPLAALATSLTRDSESVTAVKTLLTDLQTDPDSLYLYLYRQPKPRLLLVDQFEELFTQCREAETRHLFVNNLVQASQKGPKGALLLILTLRADFYGKAIEFESLRPLLENRQKLVGAMSQEEVRQAIVAPAGQEGWLLQEGLVETILQDVGREPGALPLLSHALQATWEEREGRQLTLAGYQAAGGVRKAIATTANAVYGKLTQTEQKLVRHIFLNLTELGEGTEDTRRRVAIADLLPGDPAGIETTLNLLAINRLVALSDSYAEVAHEALIREWPALRGWLDENRANLRLERQLLEAAQRWQAANQDQAYLYRGSQLSQATEAAGHSEHPLPQLAQNFLQASQEAAAKEAAVQEAQRQRELTAARQLAEARQRELEAQTRRTKAIRQALAGMATLLIMAIAAAVFGFVQSNLAATERDRATNNLATATIAQGQAQQNLQTAIAAQATSNSERDLRAAQEQLANENAATAIAAQSTAQYNANLAANREAEALAQAQIAQSQALSAASLAVAEDNPMRGLLLAITAGQTAETALAYDALRNPLPRFLDFQTFNHDASVNRAAWNGDESRILTWSNDNTARLWDAASGDELLRLNHERWIQGAAWNGDESRILTWSGDNTARLWDAASGVELLRLSHEDWVHGAVWNGDESRVLTWSYDGTARLWDAVSGDELRRLSHENIIWGTAWNGDESRILTWSADSTARLWDAASGEELLRLSHESYVYGAAWNGDESRILTWSYDGTARLWDAASREELLRLSHEDWVKSAVWNGNESRILTWSGDGTARLWDAASGEELLRLSHEDLVVGAAWNGDESRILTWSGDGTARLWDAASGEELLRLSHEDLVVGAAWNGDESRILTWSWDNTARLWNAMSGYELLLPLSHEGWVNGAAWNGDESRILTWSDDGTARLWDAASGVELRHLSYEFVVGAAWNGDDIPILTWGCDAVDNWSCSYGTVRLWDVASGAELLPPISHEDWVMGAAWNGDKSRILTWSTDGTARLWDAASGDQLLRLSHEDWVNGAAWNGDESRILTWSQDGTARLWDAASGDELLRLGREFWVNGAAWNGDESRILTWGGDGTARLWDAASGAELLRLSHEDLVVAGAAWNGDESRILTWSSDGTARLWDAANGNELLRLSHEYGVNGAAWNGDESRILTWSYDGTARVWDAASGAELLHLSHDFGVNGAAWNGDESRILTWSYDGTARLWDAASGDELFRLNHEGSIRGAAWNGDESRILTWSQDGTARVWDGETGQLLFSLSGDGSGVIHAQWSQDERRILLVTEEGAGGLFYTQMADLLAVACQRTTRNFTWAEWQLYFPGQPYRPICPQWPADPSVPPEN